ncbi:uncharacterized protein LOC132544376 [Ylistrum balloti]|uniref:uncharacterized protein LOC132544376 n=1 Tax=Ylistrum balloti TaxID=509963 RepID=UPI002905AB97|nr:uncharacterized protein LOC132544376 [Ylistrum balloti]
MAAAMMDPTGVGFLLQASAVIVTIVVLFVIQITFGMIAFRSRCQNLFTILLISAVGLSVQSVLIIALFNSTDGWRNTFHERHIYNCVPRNSIQQHEEGQDNAEYIEYCGDFRMLSLVLSVVHFVVLMGQTPLNNSFTDKRKMLYCGGIVYFCIVTCIMGWVYWPPNRDISFTTIIESLHHVTLPTCLQAAREQTIPVLMETLGIYVPALCILSLTDGKWQQCAIFKNCLTEDGTHCDVCCGANGLLSDCFMFYALIMVILRPALYIYYSIYDSQITEIFVFGCNLFIPIVLSINAIPYLNSIFIKRKHLIYGHESNMFIV